MKKWLFIGAGITAGLLALFGVSLLLFSFFSAEEGSMASGDAVGLVELKGMIVDSRETIRQLHYFLKQDEIKAVVLRVDSPGGVVAPSQEIHEEVKKLAATKKVVVSMGSLAASGGYYVAAPASLIYANPGTITGSIGVIIKLSNLQELMAKVGMKVTTIKTGKFKDVGSSSRPVTDEDRALLQGVIDSSYGQFVKAVAEGRHLPEAEVRGLADGRIFTGEQAVALKLVDRLGNLQDALAEAGRLGGITGEPPLFKPRKQRKLLDLLVEETASRISGMAGRQGVSVNYEFGGGMEGR